MSSSSPHDALREAERIRRHGVRHPRVNLDGEPLINESRNATEEAILDAARDALADTEYRRLTMDVIAKRAFTSRTALYFYFPNKRAL
ncbi:MAG: TetR/AcrR family transcriptional regulator, ethionamide resistance regulator, partial [Baekduia sp.]|nr:TetR/AcrR family transcriptional regulator, ethionamide resistance regulator [Baekduia sp.]